MLCNLRMIHRDDAGIPTAAPSIIRVAVHGSGEKIIRKGIWFAPTNITPHWGSV